MNPSQQQTILSVHHWTESLFSLTCTRDPSFRFENGQFTLIGLEANGKPLMRAYSMVSANYEEHLEFLSIKVPDGPLTSRLQYAKVGDLLYVSKKATGTLIADNLRPGRTLWLLSTGTGIAPFISLVKDLTLYEKYDHIVLTQTCRFASELAYYNMIHDELPHHPYVGESVQKKLRYYPTVTREPFATQGRITDLIHSKKLFSDLGLPEFSIENDRLMLCGSPEMLKDMRTLLKERGFTEGSHAQPAEYVVEKAFVA